MGFNNFSENSFNNSPARVPQPRIKIENQAPEKRFDRPGDFLEILKPELARIQREVNDEYGKILDESAAIKMDGRRAVPDGEEVDKKEMLFASEEGKTIEKWRADREREPGMIAEMAVAVALHSRLQENFIVARASKWDDVKNGVDFILLDKDSGAMVCGVDMVIGCPEGEGVARKDNKIMEKMEVGGADIRYGATIKNGNLFRQEMKEIPTFFLAISWKELLNLLNEIKNKKNGRAATESLGLLDKLITSLEKEYAKAEKDLKLSRNLKDHLLEFEDSLSLLKEIYQDSI
jgi:hypothetical protein